jgi:hypothetical protein
MPLRPESLRANSDVAARLRAFGIALELDGCPDGSFTIDGVDRIRLIGSDDSGGAFVLLPSSHVLYASSAGRAGIIAADFEGFIRLIVARPYWRDILKFSAGGDIEEMRRAAEVLEATLVDEDDVNEARVVCAELDLHEADDTVGALYDAVAASDAIVRASDGSPFTTLFNRFGIKDHPMVRNAAA